MAKVQVEKSETQSPARRREEPALWPSAWIADPFSPFLMMRRLADAMDRNWADIFGRGREGGESVWPAIEVYEQDNVLNICADMPGMKPEDVKVEITDNGIAIRGERKQEREERREGMVRSERTYGSFFRNIPLPEGADAGNAKAEFRDGELRITMPIQEERRKRREIPVTAG